MAFGRREILEPGLQAATITVTLDTSASQISQSGTYGADLVFGSSTPYPILLAPVTLTAT